MSTTPTQAGDVARRAMLIVLAVLAAALLVATPWLITPYPQGVPWYESTGAFPRFALALVAAGALGALLARAASEAQADSEEMDASASRPVLMATVAALFMAYSLLTPLLGFLSSTLLFALAAARAVGLPWRTSALLAAPLAIVLWLVFARGLQVAFGGLL